MGEYDQHPSMINAINTMITKGYEKEQICEITGASPHTVDSHMIRRGLSGAPASRQHESERNYVDNVTKERKLKTKVRTEAEIQAAKDRMAKAREARKPKKSDGINAS